MHDSPRTDDAPSIYPHTMRLQRYLARAGVASRRGSENLMTAGRVRVNGVVVTELGAKVDVDRDVVEVDGVRVKPAAQPTYLMLNKPAGYLTTMSDPQGRPCVAELVPIERHPGLFPVGRLDFDTTGLLLFTTDGDLAQAMLHPSHHIEKTYLAHVDGEVHDRDLEPLRTGIVLDDGPCQPARCRVLSARETRVLYPQDIGAGTSVVEMVIREGRKHQVKRMLGAIHHPVIALYRPRFASLVLDDLAPGAWRYLTEREIADLRATIATATKAVQASSSRASDRKKGRIR